MKRMVLWSAFAALILMFSSCSKDPLNNLTQEEARIYITHHDSTADFQRFKTFSIADSVAVIANNRLEGRALTNYDAQVISAVKAAMSERGFTLVSKSANPDLGINLSRVTNTYTGVMSYGDYYGYYDDFYDPFYWGYSNYGYFPPTYSYGIYQINEGGLSVDMLNLKDAAANGNQIKTVWTALARGSGVFSTANTGSQVQAFFNQSPYLKTSN